MDLRQLRYFSKVAHFRGFSAAAQALHVSQPALGMQVKKLEDELGVRLLARHSRGVSLTPAGEVLNRHTEDILNRLRLAEDELRKFGQPTPATVRIGVTPSIGASLAPEFLDKCADSLEGVELAFVQRFSSELDSLFDSGGLNLTFSHQFLDRPTELSTAVLHEPLYVIGSQEAMRDLPDPVPVARLAKLKLCEDTRAVRTKDLLHQIAAAHGVRISDLAEIESINIRREMVVGGHAFGVVPWAMFDKEIRDGRVAAHLIDDPRMAGSLYLNSRSPERLTRAEAAVRTIVLECIAARITKSATGWYAPAADP